MKLSTFNFQFSTLLLAAFLCFQSVSAQTSAISDEARKEIREKIGLDMSVSDFEVKKIDDKKMGTRLANLLRYLEENYSQGSYSRWITSVLREQNEEFENVYPEVTKIKLESASKAGNEIIVKYKILLGENPKIIKQTFVTFYFMDGVSESKTVNDMFSYMSRYVQAREQLNK